MLLEGAARAKLCEAENLGAGQDFDIFEGVAADGEYAMLLRGATQ
jgi:hypothetical protein